MGIVREIMLPAFFQFALNALKMMQPTQGQQHWNKNVKGKKMSECYICDPQYDISSHKPNRICNWCRLTEEVKQLTKERDLLLEKLIKMKNKPISNSLKLRGLNIIISEYEKKSNN